MGLGTFRKIRTLLGIIGKQKLIYMEKLVWWYMYLGLSQALWMVGNKMGLTARKPVFGVSDTVRLKPTCSATETS